MRNTNKIALTTKVLNEAKIIFNFLTAKERTEPSLNILEKEFEEVANHYNYKVQHNKEEKYFCFKLGTKEKANLNYKIDGLTNCVSYLY